VDPYLEVSEITQRVVRAQGPALLFTNPRGADFPLVTNLYGSNRRIELAIGRDPAEVGQELVTLAERMMPPTPAALWSMRHQVARARFLRPRTVHDAPVQEVVEAPRLTRMPHLTSWPRDGGPFVTFGPTITRDPATGKGNYGLYRLHVYDDATTGMHWQSMKGGRGHHYEAERRDMPLEAAAVIGGDPLTMLAAILPLPEGMDELSIVGFIRGSATRLVRARTNSLMVPANAEFILEGTVAPHERRPEGPFGDHFGHYSEAAPFPVFHVKTVTRRRNAIYPATIVGKPPQEDKFIGKAAGEMIGPLIRVINPNIVNVHAFRDASFHNLLGVSLRERHPKEVLKTAFNLLGTGQLALTKMMVMVRETVDASDFGALLRELWYRFEPSERMLLIPIAPLDTLDYTSYRMHVGSKVVFDATGESITGDAPPSEVEDPSTFDRRVTGVRVLDGGFVVVQVASDARAVLERLVAWPGLGAAKFVVAVSDDVDLRNQSSLEWGIFTRFDPARDMVFASQRFVGAKPVYEGRIGIDATWKEGYPLPLTMPDEIVATVDRRWRRGEYGL
jgi:4-hydroxy-3-polyprenylbenzoate decarboxylase